MECLSKATQGGRIYELQLIIDHEVHEGVLTGLAPNR